MGVAKSFGAFLWQQLVGGAGSGHCKNGTNTSPRWRRWPLGFESPLRGALTTRQPFRFRFL